MAANFGRVILTDATDAHTLVVYRNVEWEEFIAVVRYRPRNAAKDKPVIVSTYHSDDRGDALSTGFRELAEATLSNNTRALDPELY